MAPNFVKCPVCGRQFTPWSLEFHEVKCREIWNAENSKLAKAEENLIAGNKQRTQMVKNIPKKQSSPSKQQKFVHFEDEFVDQNDYSNRPQTVTINGKRDDSREILAIMRLTRVCYICGQRFGKSSMEVHEKKCLQFWHTLIQELPAHMKKYFPRKLSPPSLDGTVDSDRLNALAVKSSQMAQHVDCDKCKGSIALIDAKQHAKSCRGVKAKKRTQSSTNYSNNSTRDYFVSTFNDA